MPEILRKHCHDIAPLHCHDIDPLTFEQHLRHCNFIKLWVRVS